MFIYLWFLLFQINYRDIYEAGLLTTQVQVVHNTYSLGETVIAMLNIIYSVVPFRCIFSILLGPLVNILPRKGIVMMRQ